MNTKKDVVPLFPARGLDDLEEAGREKLRQALEDLRMEIRTFRKAELEPVADLGVLDWAALFDTLRFFLGRLGMKERSLPDDDFGLDLDLLARLEPVLEFMREHYWRVRVEGIENIPASSPCLFVANRSGLVPYDGMMLAHLLSSFGDADSRVRFMVSDSLVSQPFLQPWLARLGAVRACKENAERLLDAGFSVITFPEGDAGASKSFRERYTLVRFSRDGGISAALARGIPLVPVGIVGAEETHPLLAKVPPPQSAPGLPFLPLTPTFPALGALGGLPLPSRWGVHFGTPWSRDDFEGADDDEMALMRVHAQIRERIQTLVRSALKARGSVWS